jgi:hypothetical protein
MHFEPPCHDGESKGLAEGYRLTSTVILVLFPIKSQRFRDETTSLRPTVKGPIGPRRVPTTSRIILRHLLEVLGCWEKPEGPAGDGWRVDRAAVNGGVHAALSGFGCSGSGRPAAQDYVDRWMAERLRVRATKPMVDALERFHEAVVSRHLCHDATSVLTLHVAVTTRSLSGRWHAVPAGHPLPLAVPQGVRARPGRWTAGSTAGVKRGAVGAASGLGPVAAVPERLNLTRSTGRSPLRAVRDR